MRARDALEEKGKENRPRYRLLHSTNLALPHDGHADQLRDTAATVLRCARAPAARSLPCPTKQAVARQLHSLVRRHLLRDRARTDPETCAVTCVVTVEIRATGAAGCRSYSERSIRSRREVCSARRAEVPLGLDHPYRPVLAEIGAPLD